MITTTFDPILDALILGLLALAPCLSWWRGRNTNNKRPHPADPFFGAVGVVAGLAVVTTLLMVLGAGLLALAH